MYVIPFRPKEDLYLDFDMIERWLVMKCPQFEAIYLFVLAKTFGMALYSTAGSVTCRFGTSMPEEGERWIFIFSSGHGNHPSCQQTVSTLASAPERKADWTSAKLCSLTTTCQSPSGKRL